MTSWSEPQPDSFDRARALLQPRRHHVSARCGRMAPFEQPRHVADRIVPLGAAPAEGPGS
ncbi:hypothetical protein QA943_36245 [Streptomyces sp. B21-097]|uniref:hypothetical protein n=1 Tax=Streptomyces sp. B21-097 TaxID=3039414 RepID=UPI002FF18B31